MLNILRKKINSIDIQITSLLKKRSFIIPKVKKIKSKWNYHVAFKREVDMAKKIQKKDFGLYKNSYMQKIWRELISATLNIECGLKVQILDNKPNLNGLWEITKDHFGSSSTLSLNNNATAILQNLINKTATVVIMPYPQDISEEANKNWWLLLLKEEFKHVRINLELPFIKDFIVLNPTQGLCLSLNTKDTFTDIYFYIIKGYIQDNNLEILDHHNNYYFVKSSIMLKTNNKEEEIQFIGSSPKSI